MGTKANALIEQMQAVNTEVIRLAQSCSTEQWQLPVVEEDGRPVGVVFHHIALAYPFSLDWAGMIANGDTPPAMTRAELDAFNEHHAQEQANISQTDTLAFLRQVTEETALELEQFSDEQLAQTAAIELVGGREFSAQWVMEAFAIGHAQRHMKAIEDTLNA